MPPTSRVYAFGEPDNDGESRVILYLDQHLPPEYRIYHNLERQGGGQTYDWDVLVLAPHALFCLEVKDWPSRIVGNDREWLLNNKAVRRNPYPLIAKKARILKSRLVENDAFLKQVWTEPLVVIADSVTQLVLRGDCAQHTVTLKDVISRLTDKTDPKWTGRNLRNLFEDIDKVLTKDFRHATSNHEVAQFRLLEQIGATDLYTEWRAVNRYAASPVPVRLKIYAPDPYLPKSEQDKQLLLVRRDFEAAARMGIHPNLLSARDFFPDEGGRYILVLDDIPGASLVTELLAGHSLTFEYKLRLIEDIAAGLAHAHACKVVHRDIHPGNIWVTPTGAILINFDCARVGNGNTIHKMIEDGLDIRYLAPEVQASAAAATSASDVFALGAVLYELLTGGPPENYENSYPPSSIDALVDPELDRLTLSMLAIEPAVRPTAVMVRDALAELREQYHSSKQVLPESEGPASESSLDFSIGEKIEGQYLVREILGEGSYGKVYRVYAAVPDREYAMKVFHDRGLGLEDAQKEFATLSKLTHPRIARVWHAGRLRQGTCYLLTDCISGRPLHQLLGADRLAPTDALHITRDILTAVNYLHDQHYIHRDIKPSNIISSPAGTWLIDFNIAVSAISSGSVAAGTPRYTPPDVATCAMQPTRDLFAVGVVLYELLTGHHPYGGPPRLGAVPQDPLIVEPRLSEPLARLLRKAVAPDASKRYSSAEEFLADLDAIEEPLKPLPPQYPLAQGIDIPPEERAKLNYNPYLTRFLPLYSQNRIDNSGTRGYDEVSRATYVRTKLEKRLGPDILAGKFRLVLITGNAGDGKTAFLQSLEEKIHKGEDRQPSAEVTPISSGNGATFVLNGRTFRTNYDGSQNEDNLQNDDALSSFFEPFAGTADEIASRPMNLSRLIAINEGKLRDFLSRRNAEFPWLAEALIDALERGQLLPEGYLLVNLNDRSVVAGDNSILNQQIEALCDPAFWEPCQSCQYANRCPVKFNIDTLNHPDLGLRVRQRLEKLFQIAHLRGHMHLTMRGVRSALAYILFGEEGCDAITANLDSGMASNQDEQLLLRRFYYNAISTPTLPTNRERAENEEMDRLLSLLSEADLGLGANPSDDRDLHFRGIRTSQLLPSVTGRADYDRDLLQAMGERLASDVYDDEARAAHRQLHAVLRRKAFFERPDDGWEAMLPYSTLQLMLRACEKDETALTTLKATIIQGINYGEGLSNVEDSLVVRLARGVPGRVRSFRLFPASEFIIRPALPSAPTSYVEYSPAYLELIHRPGTNGNTAGRPVLRLRLDLVELLSRMARGYAPTAAEWRGPLVNLLVFRIQLSHEPYEQLMLVEGAQDQRFRVQQQGGQIVLAQEDLRDASR